MPDFLRGMAVAPILCMNTARFQVRNTGLIVPGMPFDWAIRTFRTEKGAEAYAAKFRERAPKAGSGMSAALVEAWAVVVVRI